MLAQVNLLGDVTLRQTANHGFEWSEQMMMSKDFELGDMDGDGDVDVVYKTVMLRNVTHHPSAGGVLQQFGVPTKGSRGIRPQLGATGPFRPGDQASLVLRHVPKAIAVLAVGVTETNLSRFPWYDTNTYVAPQLIHLVVQLASSNCQTTDADRIRRPESMGDKGGRCDSF